MTFDHSDPNALRKALAGSATEDYWRTLEEYAKAAPDQARQDVEFEQWFSPGIDRRRFLQLMGASLALAGLAGCDPAPETAVPYVRKPEQVTPGVPQYYASAVTLGGIAQPVLGTTRVGRPTKLEGNPQHPACLGRADAFTQAAILRLYDPDRAQTPRQLGRESSWQSFLNAQQSVIAQLDASQGHGLHLLLGASTSPTLMRQLEEFKTRWPQARLYRHEPFEGFRYAACERAFGEPLEITEQLSRAEWVVAFDHDLLGPGPLQTWFAMGWGDRRLAARDGNGDARLIVVESLMSVTGGQASERRAVSPQQLIEYVRALGAALGEDLGPVSLAPADMEWVLRLADALKSRPGRCLVSAGPYTDPALQAAVLRLNIRLGNIGQTLAVTEPLQILKVGGQRLGTLSDLAQAMAQDEVDTLLTLDSNPVYSAPGDLHFAERLARIKLHICAGLYYDETAVLSHWHLPMSDALDNWGDARAADGRAGVQQPMVRPFYESRALVEMLPLFSAATASDAHEQVRRTWQALSEPQWREALETGWIAGSEPDQRQPALRGTSLPDGSSSASPMVLLRPDPTLWDGRFANLGWLQELPKPISQLTWDTVIGLSPATAQRLQVRNGSEIEVAQGESLVRGPVWIFPGQHDDAVVLFAGHGRERAGQVAERIGYTVQSLQVATMPFQRPVDRLHATGVSHRLATTQLQHDMGRSDLIRRYTQAQALAQPVPAETPASFYPAQPAVGPQWGMVIDLDQCIGCNACMVACQAENNVPVVGKEQVLDGRAMHWLRVDHYYAGPSDWPSSHFLPVPCMHCEQAPCEMGCPVNATVHGAGGLNEMVYNRCIGTRTCSSFCPYKVRRFNWYDWSANASPSIQAQRNPEVSVRARGVMEKCTYCVQRIDAANVQAGKEQRSVGSDEVRTACQQTCPTQAITFGNIADPDSQISRLRSSGRHYSLLESLNTRPRTTYLGEVDEEDPA